MNKRKKTNALLHYMAKTLLCEEMLETCNAIIKAAIDSARRAEQELGVVEVAVNMAIILMYLYLRKRSW